MMRYMTVYDGIFKLGVTLPKTNSLPLKPVVFNRDLLFQGAPIFRGELLVSGREASGGEDELSILDPGSTRVASFVNLLNKNKIINGNGNQQPSFTITIYNLYIGGSKPSLDS